IGTFPAHAAAWRRCHDLIGREFALVENVEHFPPDIAGRADHCDFVTHRSLSEEKCHPPPNVERKAAALLCEKRRQHNVTMVGGRLMHSFWADDAANPPYPGQIGATLTNFADELTATVARLFAYMGVLALFGILGIQAWDKLRADLAAAPAAQPGWSVADRSSRAFALSPQ